MIKVSSESSVRPVATIDSVVFDLNGTLVDSRGALARTRSEAVRQPPVAGPNGRPRSSLVAGNPAPRAHRTLTAIGRRSK